MHPVKDEAPNQMSFFDCPDLSLLQLYFYSPDLSGIQVFFCVQICLVYGGWQVNESWSDNTIEILQITKLYLNSPPRAVNFSWWWDCVPQWPG